MGIGVLSHEYWCPTNTGREAFRTAAYRRVAAGLAATADDGVYHVCGCTSRAGYGMFAEAPILWEQGLVEGGVRGSWSLAWPG